MAYELRARLYYEEGYTATLARVGIDLPDAYDAHSYALLALHRGMPIATLRLISLSPSSPTLDRFNLQLPPAMSKENTLEIASLIMDRAHRGRGSLPMLGLFAAAVNFAIEHRIRYLFGNTHICLYNHFARHVGGFSLLECEAPSPVHLRNRQPLAPFFARFGGKIVPFLIDLRRMSLGKGIAEVGRSVVKQYRQLARNVGFVDRKSERDPLSSFDSAPK